MFFKVRFLKFYFYLELYLFIYCNYLNRVKLGGLINVKNLVL